MTKGISRKQFEEQIALRRQKPPVDQKPIDPRVYEPKGLRKGFRTLPGMFKKFPPSPNSRSRPPEAHE